MKMNKNIMEKKDKEIWRDVPNYEGYYQVSDRGRLRSFDRTVVYKDGRERFFKGRVIEGSIDKDGYRRFTLSINGEGRTLRASQLVAMAFLGHKPDGFNKVIDHINGDKLDDRLSNLRVVTHRENTSDNCFRKDREMLSSKYVGVSWSKRDKKYKSSIIYKGKQIWVNGKNKYLGLYPTQVEAYSAIQKFKRNSYIHKFKQDNGLYKHLSVA